jgi:hypothetical protein
MALKFEITKEEFEALEEGQQALYSEHGDGYRLQVEGIDPADELKEALRKEREERAEAKRKLQEFESEAEKRERERLEKQQEWEQLSKTERERAEKLDKEATGGVQRYGLLKKEAMQFIAHTPEGVKINGPDGEAWDAKQLGKYLTEQYPFLVDGSKASGGGAPGGKGGGAVTKKFSEHTGAELKALKEQDPEAYKRLRDEHHQQR